MIEILSLPRRPKEVVASPSKSMAKSGLPINSLPGWEHIPLNSKLPMLKCPGNQVIFTKNKIGMSIQSNRQMKHQFDPSGRDSYPEYNALHDSNLRNFYANERNLKRLRTNGEITDQNDVICNLKDFNEYRQQLHKSQLHVILQQMNKLEEEQHDRMLIANAENIAALNQNKQSGRGQLVLQRKKLWDQQRKEKFQKAWEINELRFANIKMVRAQIMAAIRQQKIVRQLNMRMHYDLRNDIQRRKLILLKKAYHLKSDRMVKNLKRLRESQEEKQNEKETASWKKRLRERISNEDKVQSLLRNIERQRVAFIKSHIATYKAKWRLIEQGIQNKAAANKIKAKCGKCCPDKNAKPLGKRRSSCAEYLGSFDNLLDNEICMALSATLDIEDTDNVPFDADDPIYKAAQFIMQHIVKEFRKDLSCDVVAYKNVYNRIETFFEEAKKFVMFRATQIISAARDSLKEVHGGENGTQRPNLKSSPMSKVAFSSISSTIGISSYEIHPLIEVKDVNNRKPTPAGSLDSTVVNSTTSLAQKNPSTKLCRNEIIFLEHYVIKFKREVLVGVGKRVFAAIQCHFGDKTMNVRQEVLELDRKFLISQVTKSILSHATNPLNFESMLRLSVSFLTNDITWSLQQVLLKPEVDARRISKPNLRHNCLRGQAKGMCLFCDDGIH